MTEIKHFSLEKFLSVHFVVKEAAVSRESGFLLSITTVMALVSSINAPSRSFFFLNLKIAARIKHMNLSTRRSGQENHRDRPDSGARTGAIRMGFFQSPSGSAQPVSSRAEKLLMEAAWGPWEPCIAPRLLCCAPRPWPNTALP